MWQPSSKHLPTEASDATRITAGIKGFILWVGGSLAGISALLYACGYQVMRAHLHMLGLYGFVDFNSDYFLQEGAMFFLAVAETLAKAAIILLVLAIAVQAPAAFASGPKDDGTPSRLAVYRMRLRDFLSRRWIRAVLYILLFTAWLNVAGASLDAFYAPLCVSDLLYVEGEHDSCGGNEELGKLAESIRGNLLAGASEPLNTKFEDQLEKVIDQMALASLAWWATSPWRRARKWLIAPFVASLGLSLLLLPTGYGVLKRPTVYPIVRLLKDDTLVLGNGPIFLIRRTSNDFTLWDASSGKVIWLPVSTVTRAEVVRTRNLFTREPQQPGGGR